jgi:hypothetical protein
LSRASFVQVQALQMPVVLIVDDPAELRRR